MGRRSVTADVSVSTRMSEKPKRSMRPWGFLAVVSVTAYLLVAAGPEGMRVPGLRAGMNLYAIKHLAETTPHMAADVVRGIVATQTWASYSVRVVESGADWSVVATPPRERLLGRILRAVLFWDTERYDDPTRILVSSNLTILSEYSSGRIYVHESDSRR